jgi:hypothetical protein
MGAAEIDAMMAAGIPFERIEAEIECALAPPDVKNVLWLYAWVECDRAARRRAVGELIAALDLP